MVRKFYTVETEAPRDSSGLCLMNADGSNNRIIEQENSAVFGDFLPDFRIAFLGWVKNSPGLWITDTLGSNKIRIYEHADHSGGISCSPDGSKILFCIYNEEKIRLEIWVVGVDGTDAKRLCIDGVYPCWSPDGKKIVYVKYNWTKQAMDHLDADGSNQRQLTYPD